MGRAQRGDRRGHLARLTHVGSNQGDCDSKNAEDGVEEAVHTRSTQVSTRVPRIGFAAIALVAMVGCANFDERAGGGVASPALQTPPPGETQAVDDATAVPYLDPEGREAYKDFLRERLHRAFAVAPNGIWAYQSAADSPEVATKRALAACRQRSAAPCRVYALNACVVWWNNDCVSSLGDLSTGQNAYEQRNFALAISHFWPLALMGDPTAQFHVARMYEKADGVPFDWGKALDWYLKAADNGHADARYYAGVIYLTGSQGLVPMDRRKAWQLVRQAADEGSARAAFQLGDWYRLGVDVPPNAEEALKWYRFAAERGHLPAAEMLNRYPALW